MVSTVTTRGQTAIPAALRRRYNIAPNSRIEWIDDGFGIVVVPLSGDTVKSLRGKYRKYGLSAFLSTLRVEERKRGG
jgi:AbrB family looped-hinge helix DNA binding protein